MTPSPFTSPPAPVFAGDSAAEAEGQGGDLLNRARELEAEQAALLDMAAVEARYAAALAVQVEAKREQAERIEDRLEGLIERQEARLQETQANRPGLLALPGTRARWERQRQSQEAALHRLHGRLDGVREIREGMGRHGPKLEELARRKLQAQEPELAGEWTAFQEARRQHQALMRKRRQEERDRERRGGLNAAPKLSLRLERLER